MQPKLVILFAAILSVNICNATATNVFSRTALVDTGYDACKLSGGIACKNNKNLLFRGEQPLEHVTFRYDPDLFRERI